MIRHNSILGDTPKPTATSSDPNIALLFKVVIGIDVITSLILTNQQPSYQSLRQFMDNTAIINIATIYLQGLPDATKFTKNPVPNYGSSLRLIKAMKVWFFRK